MISRLRVTVLMEHRRLREDLAIEHGLSLWIEADGTRILFDTGQSAAFAGNAQTLGIDLSQADFIVLSHGHYDHTGGLEAALEAAPQANVCFHQEAGIPRYSRYPGLPVRSIGMPLPSWNALQNRCNEARICSGPVRLVEGIWITGPIPKAHPVEYPMNAFSLDESGHQPDPFRDDQALVLESLAGNLVITGCCHSGVANTLIRASQITGEDRCAFLMGGLHLLKSEASQIENVLSTLARIGVQGVLSGHCTGDEAESRMGNQTLQDPGPLKGLLKAGECWTLEISNSEQVTLLHCS